MLCANRGGGAGVSSWFVSQCVGPGLAVRLGMAPFRVLIVFASSHGQTAKIAAAIAARLREHGAEVDVCDALAGTPPPPDDYDVVGLGSHVRHGKHDPVIHCYIDRNLSSLQARQSFFFSVSLTASDKPYLPDPGSYIYGTTYATAFRADSSAAFAGALPYRQYNPILRLLMKVRSSRHGHPVDTSRDHAFTDWSQVRLFADSIAHWTGPRRRPDRALGARVRASI
ncbi:MAG TPA: flavodoxin domain-containing protein [Kofleriaceae bacterium]